MQNLLLESDSKQILSRLAKLTHQTKGLWGKMDVAQMLAHCATAFELATGKVFPPRTFIGRVLGNFLTSFFFNDKPFGKNAPTIPFSKITDQKEFEKEKSKLIDLISAFQKNGSAKVTNHAHPFFGKMKPDEWGRGMYKHLDHHLKQFGV